MTCGIVRGRSWALGVALGLVATLASAQTNVSGAIAENTAWRISDSPFHVVGDVVIQSGATLTVEPGVAVLFATGVRLNVSSGRLVAEGNADQRIRFSTQKSSGQENRGDWEGIQISSGGSGSRFDYVDLEYGSGLTINGSSVTVNRSRFRNNAGAAIRLDLSSSIAGTGNVAIDNEINAVSVPSGDVIGTVSWRLAGIPFFIASGRLSVGGSPTIAQFSPSSILQGQTATFSVIGTRLAGATEIKFSSIGLTGEILPGGTDSQFQTTVTASTNATIGEGDATVLVSAGEIRVPRALTVQGLQPHLTSLSPSVVYVGQGAGDVTLFGENFTSQSVALLDGIPIVTAFVNATQVVVTVPNQLTPGTKQLRLRTPDALNPGQFFESNSLALVIASPVITVEPASATVVRGQTSELAAVLPYPASAGGTVVSLTSSIPSIGTVPPSIVVAEGATRQTFTFSSVDVGTTLVTASRTGFASGQASVSVIAPPRISVLPTSVSLGVGRSETLTFTLSSAAPVGGVTLNLQSANAAVATVPGTVHVAAGATSASVQVSAVSIGQSSISANAAGYEPASAAVTVREISVALPPAVLVAPGLSRSVPISLSDPAPVGGAQITFTTSNAAVVAAPAALSVPAGERAINVNIAGGTPGTAQLTASATGYQAGTTEVTVEAVTISVGASSISLPEGQSRSFVVSISRPAPAGGVGIAVAVGDAQVATASPGEVFIPEGQTSAAQTPVIVSGELKGTTNLTLTAAGLVATTIPLTVTDRLGLIFRNQYNNNQLTVGKGFKTFINEVYVQQLTGSAGVNATQPVTVTLTSSDPTRVSVPSTVTIPVGQSLVYFEVTGVELTGGTPVTIDATVAGYSSPVTKLTVSVVTPIVSVCGVEANRTVVSPRDDVTLCTGYTAYPSTYYPLLPASNLVVEWSVVDDNPAGIVPGFFSASTAGTAVTQTAWNTSSSTVSWNSTSAWTGTPTTAGTYRVRGTIPGLTSATSGTVTVAAPQLIFRNQYNNNQLTVGKGFKTFINEVYVQQLTGSAGVNATQPVTVTLTSSDPTRVSVPSTVTIPVGQSLVYFEVTGVELTGGTPVTIDATVAGYSSPVTKLTVSVVTPIVSVCGVEANRTVVSPRDDVTLCTGYTAYPSTYYPLLPASNLVVEWSVVDDNPAGIVPGFFSASTAGTAVTQTAWNTSSSTVSWNSTSAWTGTPTTAGTYRVRGTIPGLTSATSGTVTVAAPQLIFRNQYNNNQLTVGKGFKTFINEVYVQQLTGSAGVNATQPVTVTLTSSDPTRVSVPSTVTIPVGQSLVYFEVTGVELTGGTPVTIDATVAGYSSPVTKLTVSVVTPIVSVCGVEANRTVVSPRDDVTLCTGYTAYPSTYYPLLPASNLVVEWSVVDDNPAGIVPGFFSASTAGTAVTQTAWNTSSSTVSWNSTSAWTGTPTTAGTYRVRGTIPGLTSATSGTVTVAPPALRFTRSSVTVGNELRTNVSEVSIQRHVAGSSFSGTEPVTVSLTCASAAICSVPSTVTIPAGQSSIGFQIDGVDIGSTVITAFATGYSSAADLAVAVVQPTLQFNSVPTSLKVGQTANVSVFLSVPSSNFVQTAIDPLVLDLVSSAATIASSTPTFTIGAGAWSSTGGQVTGLAVGTTTLTASRSGLQSVTSPIVNVVP
jgi:trimeric autotransporter adhesin